MLMGSLVYDWNSLLSMRRPVRSLPALQGRKCASALGRHIRGGSRRALGLTAAILALVSATIASSIGPAAVTAALIDPPVGASLSVESLPLVAGYNLIALTLDTHSLTASTLMDSIGQAAESVTRFDGAKQSYVTYDRKLAGFGITQEDFPIEPDHGYILYASKASTLTIQGMPPGTSQEFSLHRGYNLIGWSLEDSPHVTAALINPSAGAVQSVSAFDESKQQYVTYDVALAAFGVDQADFQMSRGHAYFVFSRESCTLTYDDGSSATPPASGGEFSALRGCAFPELAWSESSQARPGDYIMPEEYYYETVGPSGWGFNVIRLSFKWEVMEPFMQGSYNQQYLGYLDQQISFAKKYGMKVILDCHNSGWQNDERNPPARDLTPNTAYADHWRSMWVMLARRYKDSDTIFAYEIINEPSASNLNDLAALQNSCIDAIRATGDTHWIILQPYWSDSMHWTELARNGPWDTDPLDKVIYGSHQYFDSLSSYSGSYTNPSYVDNTGDDPYYAVELVESFLEWCDRWNVPGFLTEWALPEAKHGPGVNGNWDAVSARLCEALQSHDIGWTYWCYAKYTDVIYGLNGELNPNSDGTQIYAILPYL